MDRRRRLKYVGAQHAQPMSAATRTDTGSSTRGLQRPPQNQCAEEHRGGLSLEGMAGTDTEDTVTWLFRWRDRRDSGARPGRLYTIKDVGDACGLPGPVIMQLVPRTWTDEGWMYTREQLDAAVMIAADLRRQRAAATPDARPAAAPAPLDRLVCDRCGTSVHADTEAASAWLNVVEPDSSVHADTIGETFCPQCVMPCPACGDHASPQLCPHCVCTGRIPKP